MSGVLDLMGNELKEGDYVINFLPQGVNYVIGRIVKIESGGLAVPGAPPDAITAGKIQVMTIATTNFNPKGGPMGNLQKIVAPKDVSTTPPSPEEKARVDKILTPFGR